MRAELCTYPVVVINWVHYLGPPGPFSFPDSRDLLRGSRRTVLAERESPKGGSPRVREDPLGTPSLSLCSESPPRTSRRSKPHLLRIALRITLRMAPCRRWRNTTLRLCEADSAPDRALQPKADLHRGRRRHGQANPYHQRDWWPSRPSKPSGLHLLTERSGIWGVCGFHRRPDLCAASPMPVRHKGP